MDTVDAKSSLSETQATQLSSTSDLDAPSTHTEAPSISPLSSRSQHHSSSRSASATSSQHQQSSDSPRPRKDLLDAAHDEVFGNTRATSSIPPPSLGAR